MSEQQNVVGESAVDDFEFRTRELIAGLRGVDVESLPELIASQQAYFDRLRESMGSEPQSPAELVRLLQAAEAAVMFAHARLTQLREELDLLSRARASARRSRTHEPPARFLSRRV